MMDLSFERTGVFINVCSILALTGQLSVNCQPQLAAASVPPMQSEVLSPDRVFMAGRCPGAFMPALMLGLSTLSADW